MSEEAFQRWRAAPSNRAAFESWYDGANPPLLLQLYRMTGGDLGLAEDLLHDVVLRFLERGEVERLPTESAATAYLYAAARNRFRSHLRRAAIASEAPPVDPEPVETTPADYLLLEERLAELEAVLTVGELETAQRLAEGKTLGEIAAEEGLSYSNAGVRVHRIRKKIRDLVN